MADIDDESINTVVPSYYVSQDNDPLGKCASLSYTPPLWRESLPEQASKLRTYKEVVFALRNVNRYINASMSTDIILKLLHQLLSIFDASELFRALNDFGFTCLELLLTLLHHVSRLSTYQLCELNLDRETSISDLTEVIIALVASKQNEWHKVIQNTTSFFYTCSDADVLLKVIDEQGNNFASYFFYYKVLMKLICRRDILTQMRDDMQLKVFDSLAACVRGEVHMIQEWACVQLEVAFHEIFLLPRTGRHEVLIPSLPHEIRDFAYCPRYQYLLVNDVMGKLHAYKLNASTFEIEEIPEEPGLNNLQQIKFSPCGQYVAGIKTDGELVVFKVLNFRRSKMKMMMKMLKLINCFKENVSSFAWKKHRICSLVVTTTDGDVLNVQYLYKTPRYKTPRYKTPRLSASVYHGKVIGSSDGLDLVVNYLKTTTIPTSSVISFEFIDDGFFIAQLKSKIVIYATASDKPNIVDELVLANEETTVYAWKEANSVIQLAAGYNSGLIKVWELVLTKSATNPNISSTVSCTFENINTCAVTHLAFNANASVLASHFQSGLVAMVNLKQVDVVKKFTNSTTFSSIWWTDEMLVCVNTETKSVIWFDSTGLECNSTDDYAEFILKKLHTPGTTFEPRYLRLFIAQLFEMLNAQYKFEQRNITSQSQLTYTPFFRALINISLELRYVDDFALYSLDEIEPLSEMNWLRLYYYMIDDGLALKHRTPFSSISQKLHSNNRLCKESQDNSHWSLTQDYSIIHWYTNMPEDWAPNSDQTVFMWGSASHGQLTERQNEIEVNPKLKTSFPRVKEIVCGQNCTFVIQIDGSVWACGEGSYGRLGLGHSDHVDTLTPINELHGCVIVGLATSLGGDGHTLAVADTGEVFSWGDGDFGKLGHGNNERQRKPKQIMALRHEHVVKVACGFHHSAVVTVEGRLFLFGKDSFNQPEELPTLQQVKIGQVACGKSHNLALTSDGKHLYSWGGHEISDRKPQLVESLENVGLKRISCSVHSSVVLCNDGRLYIFGVGDMLANDYKPTLVENDINDVAVGYEYILALDDYGKLWAWGTNSHGQLGTGNFSAQDSPMLVNRQNETKFTGISAGSTHCSAWSSDYDAFCANDQLQVAIPDSVPLQYDCLQGVCCSEIRNRLKILWYFSELVIQTWKMFSCNQCVKDQYPVEPFYKLFSDGVLRPFLFIRTHSLPLARALKATTVSQSSLELPRIVVNRFETNGRCEPIFKQVADQVLTRPLKSLLHSVPWKMKLLNEAADDVGGVSDEVFTQICAELEDENSFPNLLISTPNCQSRVGFNQDRFLINPALTSYQDLQYCRFLGMLMGVAVRTNKPLNLHLAPCVWKEIALVTTTLKDIEEVDVLFAQNIRAMNDVATNDGPVPFMAHVYQSATGEVKSLVPGGDLLPLRSEDCARYTTIATRRRLEEMSVPIRHVRGGFMSVIPLPIFSLLTGERLEQLVCGLHEVDVETLKKIARYRQLKSTDVRVQWFWKILHELSKDELVTLLRFVSGRTRLPSNLKDHTFQIVGAEKPIDGLPTAQTCFFVLTLPPYSSEEVMARKLRYVINNCRSIDMDDYMI